MIDDVLDGVTARILALGLEWDGTAIPVSKGKQPRQGEGEGAATQVMVSGAEDVRRRKRHTCLHDQHVFSVKAAFWTPGNRDNVANLEELSEIENALNDALAQKPADLMGLDGLQDVRGKTGKWMSRSAWGKNWDVFEVAAEVTVIRERAAA